MAFVKKQQDEQADTMGVLGPKQAQQPQQDQQQTATNISGPQSATVGTAQQTTPQSTTPSSGSFTNIRKFFEANPQAGQKIATTVGQKATAEAGKIGEAIQQKQQEYLGKAQQAQQNIGQAQQTQQGVIQNIMGGGSAPTADQIAQYQAASKGLTTQGTSLSDIGNFRTNVAQQQAEAAKLAAQAQQVKTPTGSFDLLRKYFATPQRQYTSGVQALDTAFLRASPEAQKQLSSQMQQAATGLEERQKAASKAAAEAEQQTKTQQQAMQKAIEESRLGAESRVRSDVEKRAETLQRGRENLQSEINAAIAAGDLSRLSPEAKQVLGISTIEQQRAGFDPTSLQQSRWVSPEQYEQFKKYATAQAALTGKMPGIEGIGNYFQGASAQYSPEYIKSIAASPEEYAKAQALASLVGGQQSIITQPDLIGKGLGGEKLGISYNEAQALADAQQRVQEALALQPQEVHASDRERLAAYLQDQVNSGAMTQQTANELVESERPDWLPGEAKYIYSGRAGYNPEFESPEWAWRHQGSEAQQLFPTMGSAKDFDQKVQQYNQMARENILRKQAIMNLMDKLQGREGSLPLKIV